MSLPLFPFFKTLEDEIYWFSWGCIITAVLVFISLMTGIQAPYGRYQNEVFGFLVNGRLGWVLQESPALLLPIYYLMNMNANSNPVNFVLLLLLISHYANRTLIFPFQLKTVKASPVSVVLMAFMFCAFNGYLQGVSLSSKTYPDDWMNDLRFISGTAIFFLGACINLHSDYVLRNLRKPGETGYKIPQGGMFTYVSGANFFGEMVEWIGFAITCWSLPAAAFAIFTCANIGPRGYHHHQWYLSKFEDYPKSRRAVIPFLF